MHPITKTNIHSTLFKHIEHLMYTARISQQLYNFTLRLNWWPRAISVGLVCLIAKLFQLVARTVPVWFLQGFESALWLSGFPRFTKFRQLKKDFKVWRVTCKSIQYIQCKSSLYILYNFRTSSCSSGSLQRLQSGKSVQPRAAPNAVISLPTPISIHSLDLHTVICTSLIFESILAIYTYVASWSRKRP